MRGERERKREKKVHAEGKADDVDHDLGRGRPFGESTSRTDLFAHFFSTRLQLNSAFTEFFNEFLRRLS